MNRTFSRSPLLFKLLQIGLSSPFPSLHSQLRKVHRNIASNRVRHDQWMILDERFSGSKQKMELTTLPSPPLVRTHSCRNLVSSPWRTLAGKVRRSPSSRPCSRWAPGRSCQALTARRKEREIRRNSQTPSISFLGLIFQKKLHFVFGQQ